jgi:hypothetical protein
MSLKTTLEYIDEMVNKYSVRISQVNDAVRYLQRYGYLIKSGEIKDITIGEVLEAVSKFQDFFGTDVDGEIGPQTIKAMMWPRCGHPDFEEQVEALKRWNHKDLSIYVTTPIPGWGREDFQNYLHSTLKEVEQVCGVKFSQATSSSKANILIGIGRGNRDGFDGSSGTLAYAYLPSNEYDGQLELKFDADETWVKSKTQRGIYIPAVFRHEICHNLGLSHSSVKQALMAPFYNINIDVPQENDDIPRLQNLYGKPVLVPTDPPVDPPPGPLPGTPGATKIVLEVEGIKNIQIDGYRVVKTG